LAERKQQAEWKRALRGGDDDDVGSKSLQYSSRLVEVIMASRRERAEAWRPFGKGDKAGIASKGRNNNKRLRGKKKTASYSGWEIHSLRPYYGIGRLSFGDYLIWPFLPPLLFFQGWGETFLIKPGDAIA